MNSNEKPLFEEKQYLGFNKSSLIRRLVLAIFCFTAYWYMETQGLKGNLLFIVGIAILVISTLMMFILHLHTKIFSNAVVIEGFWTTRKVKIDIKSLVSAEAVPYSRYFFNNPVYNLHIRGTIHFYTGGKRAVKLTDRDGLVYLIGSHYADEIVNLLNKLMRGKEELELS